MNQNFEKTKNTKTIFWQLALSYTVEIICSVLLVIFFFSFLDGLEFQTIYRKPLDWELFITFMIFSIYLSIIYGITFIKNTNFSFKFVLSGFSIIYWLITLFSITKIYQIFEQNDWFGSGLVSSRMLILLLVFFIVNHLCFSRFWWLITQQKISHWFLTPLTILAIIGFGYLAAFFSAVSNM